MLKYIFKYWSMSCHFLLFFFNNKMLESYIIADVEMLSVKTHN
jgi:hypothetical protein